ncbi:MFS transporter [Mycetocola spongiae]|uniref:MFS transporter n=1 Tax=Mycetocola spongiae TaxID=2859226 RepID=UPI001CF466FC|nr:MFS transporter [Mycetocola spongiae]UCR88211.1 MFS transporter [Mycetocola spongiae]
MTTDAATRRPHAELLAWRNAVFFIFALSGLSVASWASRVPAIRNGLDIDTGTLGLLIFGMSAGAIIGLAGSTAFLSLLGPRAGIFASFTVSALGLALIGIGADSSFSLVLTGLFIFGFGNGSVDVMMNLDGAAAEIEINKTVMPAMHAFFSVGTVAGAGLGALAASLHIPLLIHASVIAGFMVVSAAVVVRFIPHRPPVTRAQAADLPPRGERIRRNLSVWKNPRMLLIGLVMLGMSFAEGSANDWIAQAVVDGYDRLPAVGAAVYAVFVLAVTAARFLGGPLIDRFGRVASLRVSAGIGVLGLLFFIFGGQFWLAVIGAGLWGIGCALGFPVGMSAAAEHPTESAARVSAVAMMGYLAFLAGPPLIGLLGEHFGLLYALIPVLILMVVAFAAAPATRTPEHERAAASRVH